MGAAAPLVLSILAFFVLSAPDQIKELYLILASDWREDWPQILLAFGSLTGLSVFIIYIARVLGGSDETVQTALGARTGKAVRVMSIALGLLPVLGAASGLYEALAGATTAGLRRSMDTLAVLKSYDAAAEAMRQLEPFGATPKPNDETGLRETVDYAARVVPEPILTVAENTDKIALVIYLAIGFCLVWAFILIATFSRMRPLIGHEALFLRKNFIGSACRYGLYLSCLTATALFAAQYLNAGADFAFDFTSIPRALGTLFLVNLWLAFLIFFCSMLTHFYDRYSIPILSALLTVALVASYWNINDNHAVRFVEASRPASMTRQMSNIERAMQVGTHERRRVGRASADERKLVSVRDAFNAWYALRPADYKRKFGNRPYPVYIVAAQGGGMYAANLSGLFLARLYDRCPAIRHHLFAVSGVSGGSVGAGLLSALLNDPSSAPLADTCDPAPTADGEGPLEKRIRPLLRADYLSPVTAGFLFPDMLQRFIPAPIEPLDRAHAFEAGLEEAWASISKSSYNPLRAPFWRHWRADGAAPMLMLNATVVETGQQVAIAPVELQPRHHIDEEDRQSLHTALEIPVGYDVRLSTAMSLSARFPLIMPAGAVHVDGSTYRLVDGGYVDNSAVETALTVIDRIKTCYLVPRSDCVEPTTRATFQLIVVTDYDAAEHFYRDISRNRSEGFNEVLSPVRALFNARIERGRLTVNRVKRNADKSEEPFWAQIRHGMYRLALGWRLSKQAQDVIAAQIGDPTRCKLAALDVTHLAWIEEAVKQRNSRKNVGSIDDLTELTATSLITGLHGSHCALKERIVDVINARQH